MLGWMRNLIVMFLVLTVVYAVLTLLARGRARDRIKGEYVRSDKAVQKDDFIAKGLRDYQRSYRPMLIVSVYLIPIAILSLLIYLANNT